MVRIELTRILLVFIVYKNRYNNNSKNPIINVLIMCKLVILVIIRAETNSSTKEKKKSKSMKNYISAHLRTRTSCSIQFKSPFDFLRIESPNAFRPRFQRGEETASRDLGSETRGVPRSDVRGCRRHAARTC